MPEEGESRHGLRLWLTLLVEHFFIPLGYTVNGGVFWTASDDPEDGGRIFVKDNRVEIVDDVIFNAGPSWAPNHYVDEVLKRAIQRLLDFADDAGCSPDLTVVAVAEIAAVQGMLKQCSVSTPV